MLEGEGPRELFAMGEDGSMIEEKKSTDRSEPSQKPIVQTETLELTPEQQAHYRQPDVHRPVVCIKLC